MKFTGFAILGLMGCALALPHGPSHPDSAPAGPPLTGLPTPPTGAPSSFPEPTGSLGGFGAFPGGLPFPIPSGIPTSLPSGLPGFGGFGGIGKRHFPRPSGSAPSGSASSRPTPSRTPTGFSQPSGSFPSASGVPLGFPPSGNDFSQA